MRNKYTRFILLIFIVIISLCSCKKEQQDPSFLLIGKWNQTSLTTINYYDNVRMNESTRNYDPGYNVLEIYEDGTAKRFIDGKLADEVYWKVEGDLLIMTGSNDTTVKTNFEVSETDLNIMWAVEESTDGHLLRTDYSSVYKKQ